MDCSLLGSSFHGILQARILEREPCSPVGDLPDPGFEPMSPALVDGIFTRTTTWEALVLHYQIQHSLCLVSALHPLQQNSPASQGYQGKEISTNSDSFQRVPGILNMGLIYLLGTKVFFVVCLCTMQLFILGLV